jgi:hypothetical protein
LNFCLPGLWKKLAGVQRSRYLFFLTQKHRANFRDHHFPTSLYHWRKISGQKGKTENKQDSINVVPETPRLQAYTDELMTKMVGTNAFDDNADDDDDDDDDDDVDDEDEDYIGHLLE